MRDNPLRQLWNRREAALNGWLMLPDSVGAEVMAQQGFDALTIDLQHGLVDPATMLPMLQAISTTDTVPIVRVPWPEPGILMKSLDAGAYGVICPMVDSADDAARLVRYTHYAPRGSRSYGPVRAALYAGADYARHADDTIVVFAMIETATALDRLDAILAVDGLDAIYIGPSDLSLALGCEPSLDPTASTVVQAIEHIRQRADAHGVVAGIHAGSAEGAKARVAQGFRFVTAATDVSLLAAGARAAVAHVRGG